MIHSLDGNELAFSAGIRDFRVVVSRRDWELAYFLFFRVLLFNGEKFNVRGGFSYIPL
jgi:hypothetical protein